VLARSLGRTLVLGARPSQRFAPTHLAAVARAVDLPAIAGRAHANLAAAERAAEDPGLGRGGRLAINLPTHHAHRILQPGTMAKIGRNDPCPCGSGKKHKRCCLIAQAPTPDPVSTAMTADANVEEHDDFCDCCLDALNERADRTLDLLLDGNLDEAEAMAHDLMRDFPDEVEGIDLLSMVSEARGERERTVGLLRRAIEIVRVHPFHDAETRLLMHQRLRQLEQRA
jgi:hypothetical protein